jgi:hypothetical protein
MTGFMGPDRRSLRASLTTLSRPRLGVVILACGLVGAMPALAAGAPGYKVPYTSLGQPDLGGTWSNASITKELRDPAYGARATFSPEEVKILEGGAVDMIAKGNARTDPNSTAADATNVGAYNQGWLDGGSQVMRVHGEPRTSFLTTPDGQVPAKKGEQPRPLPADAGTAEAGLRAARVTAGTDRLAQQGDTKLGAFMLTRLDNPENLSPGERCLAAFNRSAGPPMFNNGAYNNNYQFVQSRDAVVIDVEMVHDARIIRLNAKHRTDGVRPWFGDSIGHYEGPTLVVETTNIPKIQAYYGSWETLKITERFTRLAKDRMRYQFTVEDPTLWDKPWGGEYEFVPTNGRIMEYACHEGNYALEGMLAGAREQERLDAAAKKAIVAK